MVTLNSPAYAMDSIYLLWHIHGVNDEHHVLIGAYRSEEDAKAAIERLKTKRGFAETPDGFFYERYELNRDHWIDGFVMVD
jgi:hypothetical protein